MWYMNFMNIIYDIYIYICSICTYHTTWVLICLQNISFLEWSVCWCWNSLCDFKRPGRRCCFFSPGWSWCPMHIPIQEVYWTCHVWYGNGKVTAMQCSVVEYIWSHIVLYGNIGDCTVLYRYVWTCVGRCPHRHVWVCMGISACALCICSFMHVFIYLFIEVLMHLCIYVFRYICKSQCVHVSTYLNVYVDVSWYIYMYIYRFFHVCQCM